MTTGGAAAHASKRGARAARPIDVYKKLPFLRGAAANPEDQQSTASAQQSTEQSFTILDDENNVVRVTRRDVEAGTLATGPKQKRLNIPTPVCGEVEDYAKYARRMTDESLAYVRGIGPRRPQSSTVGRPPASSSGGILGRPPLERREWEFNEPDVANDGRAVAKEYDPADEIEYIISVQDERWLKEELPRLVQRRMGGGAQKCLDSPPPTNAGGGATSGGRKRGGSHKRKVPEELKPANGHGEADFFKEQKTALVSAPAAALVAAPVVAAPVEKVEPWAVAMAAHLTVDVLEALFDALEHACAAEGAAPVAARAADALACTEPPARGGVGARFRGTAADAAALGPLAHHYWMQQRHKLGRALIRRYWPSTAVADTNPHCVFRPREKERYKLRKHRRNDVDAFRKLQLLRRDFAQAHDLVRLVQRRELLKRLRSDAKRGKPRLDLEDLAQRHGLIPLGDEYDFADDAADYGVDVRPKAEGGVKAEPKALAADGSESKADEAMPPAADSITAVLAASAAKGGKNSAEGAESKASRISPSKRDGRAARPDWKSASAALKERLWALVVRTVEPVADLRRRRRRRPATASPACRSAASWTKGGGGALR
ncbi:hypothetical protein M885DRAFT_229823 [Pelagophyceae sp. CCMP2097]|nr:hypothetical protein M885DRAFT_229823 [Pelagophyceae sp. CCMP2097]